ncbi:MAG TPA: archaeosortase/exosortase family protein, partial [Nitrosospira sp.]|nr:archaeosortase/exosortase family protein [Nitrosospira sp.]
MSAHAPQELPHHAVTLGQQNVKFTAIVTILAVAALLGIYYKTTWSMVEIWERSDTFAHGFLIFPFSAYL